MALSPQRGPVHRRRMQECIAVSSDCLDICRATMQPCRSAATMPDIGRRLRGHQRRAWRDARRVRGAAGVCAEACTVVPPDSGRRSRGVKRSGRCAECVRFRLSRGVQSAGGPSWRRSGRVPASTRAIGCLAAAFRGESARVRSPGSGSRPSLGLAMWLGARPDLRGAASAFTRGPAAWMCAAARLVRATVHPDSNTPCMAVQAASDGGVIVAA